MVVRTAVYRVLDSWVTLWEYNITAEMSRDISKTVALLCFHPCDYTKPPKTLSPERCITPTKPLAASPKHDPLNGWRACLMSPLKRPSRTLTGTLFVENLYRSLVETVKEPYSHAYLPGIALPGFGRPRCTGSRSLRSGLNGKSQNRLQGLGQLGLFFRLGFRV